LHAFNSDRGANLVAEAESWYIYNIWLQYPEVALGVKTPIVGNYASLTLSPGGRLLHPLFF
jgi:hypothetical protein